MMRITIVTAYFAPEISPVTHLYGDLAADLAAKGAEVTVVTGFPARGLTEAEQAAYQSRRDERTAEGYRVLRVGSPGTESSGLIKRGLRLLSGAAALYRTANQLPTDAYLLGSMPPFLGPIGALLNRRARTVYVLQDIFPDTLVLMGKYGEGHPFVRLGRWMERVSYRRNARFITLSPDMADTLLHRGVPEQKLSIIGNWADTDAIRPVPRADNPLFHELGLDTDGFYAVYAGTLGPLQRPDLLLDAALLFFPERSVAANVRRIAPCEISKTKGFSMQVAKESGLVGCADPGESEAIPPVTFLIFGGGALYEHVRERIERERITNVKLFPLLPEERAGEVYSLGDVALIPLKAGTLRFAMPSKTWTAMAAGRPLIVTAEADSAWAKAVEGAGCGWVCPPEDADALAACIRTAYSSRATLPVLSDNARRFATKALSRRDSTDRYFEVLTKEQ